MENRIEEQSIQVFYANGIELGTLNSGEVVPLAAACSSDKSKMATARFSADHETHMDDQGGIGPYDVPHDSQRSTKPCLTQLFTCEIYCIFREVLDGFQTSMAHTVQQYYTMRKTRNRESHHIIAPAL